MKNTTENDGKRNINNVMVGEGVKISDFVNLYGCEIGDNSSVGPFVEIQKNVVVGKGCKIQSHSFICEGVTIGDGVFIGHNVSFTNDLFPRAVNAEGKRLEEGEWTLVETHVKNGASIGTGATILGGIKIGENALVGAGAVVVKDVPDHAVVVGNPAGIIRYIDNQ